MKPLVVTRQKRGESVTRTISRQIAILEKMLVDESTVHPLTCNCVIKSRFISHHAQLCPWRLLTEAIPKLRLALPQGEKHE